MINGIGINAVKMDAINSSDQVVNNSQKQNATDKTKFSRRVTHVGNSAISRRLAFKERQQYLSESKKDNAQSGAESKELRYQKFPGSHVLLTGKELHSSYNNGMHIADINTSKVMKKLITEGYELQSSNKPAVNSQEIERLTGGLTAAADGKLSELTQDFTLLISNGTISSQTSTEKSVSEWLSENDKPGNFLVLNGNNDETYVSFIADIAKDTKHLHFITSGFGGHGTTDRHAIGVNKTEGDRFSELLERAGIARERISIDPWSTNSGQNASNVSTILNDKIINGEPCHKVIIAGTPAAVFRQTYTYAKQLDIPSLKDYQLGSFPFSNQQQYSTVADYLAILREYSTTINYMLNTSYLPADPSLYPKSFFENAIDCFHKTADWLEKTDSEKYGAVILAMRNLTQESITRMQKGDASAEDKKNIGLVDGFYRNLFTPLELSFKRSSL